MKLWLLIYLLYSFQCCLSICIYMCICLSVFFMFNVCLFFNCLLCVFFPSITLCKCIKNNNFAIQIQFHCCYYSSGINDQGLYRVVGVSSKVQKLLSLMIGKLKSILFFFPFWFGKCTRIESWKFLIYMLPHYLCDIRLPLVSWMCWCNGCVCRGDIKKIVNDNQPIRTLSLQSATSSWVYLFLPSIQLFFPQTTRLRPTRPCPCTFWLLLH